VVITMLKSLNDSVATGLFDTFSSNDRAFPAAFDQAICAAVASFFVPVFAFFSRLKDAISAD